MFMCCCGGGSVYFHSSDYLRVANPSQDDDWNGAPSSYYVYEPVTGQLDNFAFDRLNAQLYLVVNNGGSGWEIHRHAENDGPGAPTSVFTQSDTVYSIDCDPTNERLFYVTNNTYGYNIRVVNYDGSGDTLVLTLDGNFVANIVYDATLDQVFYAVRGASDGHNYLRAVQADGTGDTAIIDFGIGAPSSIPYAHSITSDITNRQLYYGTTNYGNIWQCGMDGSGNTLVRNTFPDASVSSKLCFSQKLEKLFYYQVSSTAASRGIYRLDGSTEHKLADEVPAPNFPPQSFPADTWDFRLGAGFEKVGGDAIL